MFFSWSIHLLTLLLFNLFLTSTGFDYNLEDEEQEEEEEENHETSTTIIETIKPFWEQSHENLHDHDEYDVDSEEEKTTTTTTTPRRISSTTTMLINIQSETPTTTRTRTRTHSIWFVFNSTTTINEHILPMKKDFNSTEIEKSFLKSNRERLLLKIFTITVIIIMLILSIIFVIIDKIRKNRKDDSNGYYLPRNQSFI